MYTILTILGKVQINLYVYASDNNVIGTLIIRKLMDYRTLVAIHVSVDLQIKY